MARSSDDLLAEVLNLSPERRAYIAQALISSLEEGADAIDPESLAQEWLEEVSRRAAEIDGGTARTIPGAEVFRAARRELQEFRSHHVDGG